MQRLTSEVVAYFHRRYQICMVVYLDDSLIFGPHIPLTAICQDLQHLGITINTKKSVLQPTRSLIYLGLYIDLT